MPWLAGYLPPLGPNGQRPEHAHVRVPPFGCHRACNLRRISPTWRRQQPSSSPEATGWRDRGRRGRLQPCAAWELQGDGHC